MKRLSTYNFYLLFFTFIVISCKSDDDINNPIELNNSVTVHEEGIFNGYSLVSPMRSNNSYLINNEGFVVKKWESEYKSIMSYLTKEGKLVRNIILPNDEFSTGGTNGGIQIYDFNGNLEWHWLYSSNDYVLHHDLEILPNGNILAIVWDLISEEEAIENGRNPSLLFENKIHSCRIIELKVLPFNEAEIVWEWSVWDHLTQDFDNTKNNFTLDIGNHPELININYTTGGANFNHINSIEYIEEYDQILLSTKLFNEFWIIDHSTTTLEAASHFGGNNNKGGDLLYRWGNPSTYNQGGESNQKLFGQHDVTWIEGDINHGGNILVFNNNKFNDLSSIDEITIPHTNGIYNLVPNTINVPEDYSWIYTNPEIFSGRISGAKRLPNGNTLITEGQDGILYEIDYFGNLLWKYTIPLDNGMVFKVDKYPFDYPAFENQNMEIIDVNFD